ncbi:MAG: polyphosphate polymerase domain-containing protein [Bacteroidota bacterium]
MNTLPSILSQYQPISLDEMDNVKLLNRTDTKFIFNYDQLPVVLDELKEKYRILEMNKSPLQDYHTLYFDTPDFLFYNWHHNGKMNRYKVRYRKYIDSETCFLEVKFKNNKRRMIKKRTRKKEMTPELSEKSKNFIDNNFPINSNELIPALWNKFTRLTLVHNQAKERITIDCGLRFNNQKNSADLPHLVIAEVKQEKFSSRSDFILIMRKYHIRPMRISKYCIGSILLNKELKYNRFKPKLLAINKIKKWN